MLEQFESICDRQFCFIGEGQHQIEVNKTNGRLMLSNLYRAGSKAKELGKQSGDRMLTMPVREPAPIKWPYPIGFCAEEGRQFSSLGRLQEAECGDGLDSNQVPCLDECIDLLATKRYY